MNLYNLNQQVRFALSVLFFLVSATIGWSLSQSQGAATVIWPAAGVGVLAWLIWRSIGLAGIFVGSLLFYSLVKILDSENDFMGKISYLGILTASVVTVVQSWLTGLLVEKHIGFPIEFPRLPTASRLLAVSALTSLITPIVVLVQMHFPNIDVAVMHQLYWWWAGCMIGVVLVLPLGFYLVSEPPDWLPPFKTVAGPMIIIWGFTFVLYGIVLQVQGRSNGTLFTAQSRSVAGILEKTLNSYEDTLRAFERFITSNPGFSVDDFQEFGRPMINNVPGLLGFSLSRPVDRDNLDAFIDLQTDRWSIIAEKYQSAKFQESLNFNESDLTSSFLISDYTFVNPLGINVWLDEKQNPRRAAAINQSIATREMVVISWMTEKIDLVQIYVPIYAPGSFDPVAILSANLKIKPVLNDIFAIQGHIPHQAILLRNSSVGGEKVLFTTETIDGAVNALAKLKLSWKGVFSKHELSIGMETWEFYQFTNKPIVYDQFLLSSVIAGGFMFSGVLCWFVLVLAGNAKNISLQVQRQTQELKISADLIHASQHIARLGSWEWLPCEDANQWSTTLYSILGLDESVRPSPEAFLSLVHSEDRNEARQVINSWRSGQKLKLKFQVKIYNPVTRFDADLHLYCDWIKNEDGSKRFLSIVAQDVTDMMESQRQLMLAAATFESQDAILISDKNGQVQRVNQAYTLLFGYELEEMQKQSSNFDFLKGFDNDIESMFFSLAENGCWSGELNFESKMGYKFPAMVSVSAVENLDDGITNYVVNINNISEQKAAQSKIKQLAYYDALTGLPNRESFYLQASKLIYQQTGAGHSGALLFLDLDYFKVLNDTLGHKVGDALINEVSKRFKLVLGEKDVLARFGGDEFMLLLGEGASCHKDIKHLASTVSDKLLFSLESPLWLEGHSYKLTVSIGITIIDKDMVDVESLVVQADLAMYFAKNNGRNRYRYYRSEMSQMAQDKFNIEKKIRIALKEKSFEVFYQPQVNHLNEIIGLESLVRWNDREEGLIRPDRFIPLAEESTLIVEIESYVFEMVCMDISNWQSIEKIIVPVAINISPIHLIQSSFLSQIDDIIERYQIDPSYLCIEITERVLAEDTGLMRERIQSVKDRGVMVSIDDFGTGYSSLSYLKQLPIGEIKIAREFIQDLPHDKKDVALVRTITNLAENLGLMVIAEGVETKDQFEFLVSEGCRRFQGYYLYKPMSKRNITSLLPNGYPGVVARLG